MIRVQAVEQFDGEFIIPGDKSITHRAIILNAAVQGEAVISNVSLGEDCLSTCRCMQKLGAKIDMQNTTLFVQGVSSFFSGQSLDCGNSATTMRLLTGLLCGKNITAKLYGDASLTLRPMQRVCEPLSLLGANVKTNNGYAPINIQPALLHGANIDLNISSAQVKSAVLLAGLFSGGKTSVGEPVQSRDHTERMLQAMGAKMVINGTKVTIENSSLHPINVCVPSDISSAAYFMAIGALKGKTLCKNVGINPTRTGILKAFDLLGVKYTLYNQKIVSGEKVADIVVEKSPLHAITISQKDVPSMIDELPLIALLCAFADGESVISGAGELRVKECDRIMATAQMICALGGDCTATQDGFIIRGKKRLQGGNVDSFSDHRIAMSAAVGLLSSVNGGHIVNEECCTISFPDFFEKIGIKAKNKGAGMR